MPPATPANARQALTLGALDAAGFVLGGVCGWLAGRWLGHDVMAGTGSAPLGWALLLAGLGLGKWLARRAQRRLLAEPTTQRST